MSSVLKHIFPNIKQIVMNRKDLFCLFSAGDRDFPLITRCRDTPLFVARLK